MKLIEEEEERNSTIDEAENEDDQEGPPVAGSRGDIGRSKLRYSVKGKLQKGTG